MERDPRPATLHDLLAVQGAVQAAYAHYVPRIGREPGPMPDGCAALIRAGRVHVVAHGGAVQGVLVLQGEAMLDNVVVAPSAQGLGLGRGMLRLAERAAAEAGCRRVRLHTNEAMVEGIGLYLRLGCVETHRVEEGGLRRVYMEKALGWVGPGAVAGSALHPPSPRPSPTGRGGSRQPGSMARSALHALDPSAPTASTG